MNIAYAKDRYLYFYTCGVFTDCDGLTEADLN